MNDMKKSEIRSRFNGSGVLSDQLVNMFFCPSPCHSFTVDSGEYMILISDGPYVSSKNIRRK